MGSTLITGWRHVSLRSKQYNVGGKTYRLNSEGFVEGALTAEEMERFKRVKNLRFDDVDTDKQTTPPTRSEPKRAAAEVNPTELANVGQPEKVQAAMLGNAPESSEKAASAPSKDEGEDEGELSVDGVEGLSWRTLCKEAKDRGVATGRRKRNEIETELRAVLAAGQ